MTMKEYIAVKYFRDDRKVPTVKWEKGMKNCFKFYFDFEQVESEFTKEFV